MSSTAKRKHSEALGAHDDQQEPSKRLVAACTACRAQKIKCSMTNEQPPCSRCQRRGIECVLHNAIRHPMADAKQISLLGKDLDGMHATLQRVCQHLGLDVPAPLATAKMNETISRPEAMLRDDQNPKDTCEVSPPASPSAAHAPMDMYLTSAQEGPLIANCLRKTRRALGVRVDMISKGLLRLDDAEMLVGRFVADLDPFLYGVTSSYRDLDQIRRASPALLAAVCTVSAFHCPEKKLLFGICNREYRSIIADSIFEKRDLEFVTALSIGAFWLPDASRILLNDAIRRAKDLKLHRNFLRLTEPSLLASTSPGSATDTAEIRDRVRLWYLLYICDQHLSILHNRDRILRQEKEAVENRELFIAPGEPATPRDVNILSQVSLLVIMGQIRDIFGSESIRPISKTLSVQLAHFMRELDAWYARWCPLLELDEHIGSFPLTALGVHWQFAKLYLGHNVFRGIGNDPIPTYFVSAAMAARDAAVSIFTIIAEDRTFSQHILGMPAYFHIMISFAGQFLMGACLRYSQQLGINVEDDLRRIGSALAIFARTSALPSHPLARMTAGLKRKIKECTESLGFSPIVTESPYANNTESVIAGEPPSTNTAASTVPLTLFDLQAANGLPDDYLYSGFEDMTFPDAQYEYAI